MEIFRDGVLVGGRFTLLAVHEKLGGLLLECYDPTIAKVGHSSGSPALMASLSWGCLDPFAPLV